ncbi:uncharacterized protein L199_004117 [Kwoniella botswanensis]|uniref:uncharacterized protein n=1 Tax=Kwoniella botswanensis TaxID=1268659 RepID=UPI00315D80CE
MPNEYGTAMTLARRGNNEEDNEIELITNEDTLRIDNPPKRSCLFSRATSGDFVPRSNATFEKESGESTSIELDNKQDERIGHRFIDVTQSPVERATIKIPDPSEMTYSELDEIATQIYNELSPDLRHMPGNEYRRLSESFEATHRDWGSWISQIKSGSVSQEDYNQRADFEWRAIRYSTKDSLKHHSIKHMSPLLLKFYQEPDSDDDSDGAW